uniref:Uncharacterized protein n=1 Tax=Arundo donax TaxID=35708 RepID=A0A0A9HEC5_ARUDO
MVMLHPCRNLCHSFGYPAKQGREKLKGLFVTCEVYFHRGIVRPYRIRAGGAFCGP